MYDKCFLYYFLTPMCIRSNLSFVLNHKRYCLKISDVFNFSDIQCYIIFFRWKWGTFGPSSLNLNPYPQKTLACYTLLDFNFLVDYEYQTFIYQKWHGKFRLCFNLLKNAWVQAFYYMLLLECIERTSAGWL